MTKKNYFAELGPTWFWGVPHRPNRDNLGPNRDNFGGGKHEQIVGSGQHTAHTANEEL